MNAYDKGTYEERVRTRVLPTFIKNENGESPVIAWLFSFGHQL